MSKIDAIATLQTAKKVRLHFLKQPLSTKSIPSFVNKELFKSRSNLSLPCPTQPPSKKDCRTVKGLQSWLANCLE